MNTFTATNAPLRQLTLRRGRCVDVKLIWLLAVLTFQCGLAHASTTLVEEAVQNRIKQDLPCLRGMDVRIARSDIVNIQNTVFLVEIGADQAPSAHFVATVGKDDKYYYFIHPIDKQILAERCRLNMCDRLVSDLPQIKQVFSNLMLRDKVLLIEMREGVVDFLKSFLEICRPGSEMIQDDQDLKHHSIKPEEIDKIRREFLPPRITFSPNGTLHVEVCAWNVRDGVFGMIADFGKYGQISEWDIVTGSRFRGRLDNRDRN